MHQAHVSYNVIDDSSVYTITPRSNVEWKHGTELLIYTPVKDKKHPPPFRLFDNVKCELWADGHILFCVIL